VLRRDERLIYNDVGAFENDSFEDRVCARQNLGSSVFGCEIVRGSPSAQKAGSCDDQDARANSSEYRATIVCRGNTGVGTTRLNDGVRVAARNDNAVDWSVFALCKGTIRDNARSIGRIVNGAIWRKERDIALRCEHFEQRGDLQEDASWVQEDGDSTTHNV